MGLYCGIDLHSNNHVVTVIDEGDRRLYERPFTERSCDRQRRPWSRFGRSWWLWR